MVASLVNNPSQAQRLLEEAILQGYTHDIAEQIEAGANPFAFPEHVLAKCHPKSVARSLLSVPIATDAAPGEISLIGLLVLSAPVLSATEIPTMMRRVGRPFDVPPAAIAGKKNIDLLELMAHPSVISNWSRNIIIGSALGVYRGVVNAMNLEKPLVRDRLSLLAKTALDSSSEEINRPGSKVFNTHETFGFNVFASLVLMGVDLPKEVISKRRVEFDAHVPILSSAVYYGQSDPAPPERDDLIRRLVSLGASVNAGNAGTDQTPLMCAAARADVRAMKVLIDEGADLFAKDSRNWMARSYAKNHLTNSAGQGKKRGANALAFCDAAIAHARMTQAIDACFIAKARM